MGNPETQAILGTRYRIKTCKTTKKTKKTQYGKLTLNVRENRRGNEI